MMASHYAHARRCTSSTGRATPSAAADRFGAAGIDVRVIDGSSDLVTTPARSTPTLRAADDDGCTDVIAVLPPPIGLGHAIRDRLQKAAATRVEDFHRQIRSN